MMMVFLAWLGLLFFFLITSPFNSSSALPSSHFPSHLLLCHPHESSVLLHFKNSLSITYDYCADSNSTVYWNMSRDCCTWSGVTCDEVSGHVVRLDLGCSGLQGIIHSNNSLFLLTHLQSLVLFWNQLDGSEISPEFGRFSSMIHLDLSDSGFTGQLPLEFSYLSSLVTLDLSHSDLRLETSSLKRIVANLTSIKELRLSRVDMSFASPNSFMNLSTSLASLDLSESGLTGEFPEKNFHLPRLQKLDLSYNSDLSGSFPQYNWSSQLRNLNLSGTGFLIDLPYLTKTLKSLNTLFLSSCMFRGLDPALLGNLTQITSLDLSFNNFGSQIPWSFLNLEKLTHLDLSSNNFIGQLPDIFCNNSTKTTFSCDFPKHQSLGSVPLNLKVLSLSYNLLNGMIPTWLYSLPYLQDLDLSRNQFTGHIDEFQYSSLVTLDLASNKLQGFIPQSIFQQVNLSRLDLSSNNLSGSMWLDQFSKLKYLSRLGLSFYSISRDSINSIISALPNTLQSLSLSSCNISEFPLSLRSFENLRALDLSSNRIEGRVPQWLWNVGKDSLVYLNVSHNHLTHFGKIPWKFLFAIDLSSNRLQGQLPNPPPSTLTYLISNNQLVGGIPALFCDLSELEVLDLSNNSLSGNILPCLFGNFSSSFSVLDLRMNRFHGMIPSNFAEGNYLSTLTLNGNQLEGPLPQSLLNCENLEVLDVGNNRINGSFPFWLESLPYLQVLILRSNRFAGPLSNPKARFPFQRLRILDLSNNQFTGPLPAEYFRNFVAMMDAHADSLEYMIEFTRIPFYYQDSAVVAIKGLDYELVIHTLFIAIDLSRNYFTGEIPKSIGMLQSLKGLSFSSNRLTGSIPASLGNITSLEWLDLSSNDLIGQIPPQLADLTELGFLNLSLNKLEGPIPSGKQFNTFNNDSYSGNLGLCGFPLSELCSNDESQHEDQSDDDEEHSSGMIDWKVVMMGYTSGLVIGISIGYMVLFSRGFDYWFLKRFGGGGRRRTSTRSRGRRSN